MRTESWQAVPPWTFLILALGLVQFSYAIYLIQHPDWSSAMVTAHASMVLAAFYAVGLGVSLFADVDTPVIAALGLADRHHAGQLTGWCLLMLSLCLVLAYQLGRSAQRWHQRETAAE